MAKILQDGELKIVLQLIVKVIKDKINIFALTII